MDSVPLVAITGQVGTHGDRQATPSRRPISSGITLPITKHNYLVHACLTDLARTIKEAFHIARTGRPGPVLVDIPKDVFQTECEFIYPESDRPAGLQAGDYERPPARQINEAAALLARRQKPLIIVGHGVIIAGAYDELRPLRAQDGHLPWPTTLLGISAFPQFHPLNFGLVGMHGWPTPTAPSTSATCCWASACASTTA